MIHLVIGTKAQLIKMAPVMRALQEEGLTYRYISTGQHLDTTADILDNFRLRRADVVLYDGPDITSIPAMTTWGLRILWQTWRNRETVFGTDRKGIVLVHGDTFSTLLGALMGRLAGLTVGHVESGLRSFNLLHPFPEEVIRRLVFRMSQIYFCPGPRAIANLSHYSGKKVDTVSNTLRDALRMAFDESETPVDIVPTTPFAIASIHRFENIYSRPRLSRIVSIITHIAERVPILFILHKPTERKLRAFGLYDSLATTRNVQLRPRYDYFRFIGLLKNSEFVVSDGGSNQEECHYMGKPVLLLRMATERHEGLESNCTLSRYDPELIDRFLEHYRQMTGTPDWTAPSPSQIIARVCAPYN